MSRILILDTMSVLHVVKFSLGKTRLTDKDKNTFIIHGFLQKLNFLLRKTSASICVYALDSKTSKRRELYSIYKAKRNQNRTEKQIALDKLAAPQFEKIINHVLPTMGHRNLFGKEGFEADDAIGSVCKKYKNDQIVICTTDHDMYQLLSNNVCIINAKTNNYYTITDFKREFDIEPKMWKRVKAIGGCSSDNVKGVPIPQLDSTKKQRHVAEKGALNYIKGQTASTTKAHKAIESRKGKNIINRNKSLVILPFKGTPEFNIRPDHLKLNRFTDMCEEYEFKTILSNMDRWKSALKLR